MGNRTAGNTIVFIHGLFATPMIWSDWITFFERKGYKCFAPPYPFHQGNPADLRTTINPDLRKLTFGQVTSSLSGYVDSLPDKPILIGHSMGGLVVQKLIEGNKGVAGICLDAAPPKGIFSFKWSFLKSGFPILNPLKGDSVYLPNVKWFNYAVCNTQTMEETQLGYDRLVVPESRNIVRSVMMTRDGKIDFKKPHNPLLFIAGEKDHIIPPSLNKRNFKAYTDKNSKTDFKEFKGRTHDIFGQEGWEEIAEYVEKWISGLK